LKKVVSVARGHFTSRGVKTINCKADASTIGYNGQILNNSKKKSQN